jgi:hypothetical protein
MIESKTLIITAIVLVTCLSILAWLDHLYVMCMAIHVSNDWQCQLSDAIENITK